MVFPGFNLPSIHNSVHFTYFSFIQENLTTHDSLLLLHLEFDFTEQALSSRGFTIISWLLKCALFVINVHDHIYILTAYRF